MSSTWNVDLNAADDSLTLGMLGKIYADNILKYFFLFPEKRILHFIQIVGDNLQWNVKFCFLWKIRKLSSNLLFAKLAQSVVKV